MATKESISPREFCGSRAVWLGDSHKHSNCGEKAEATDGRVLHQSAHGRSERAGGVLAGEAASRLGLTQTHLGPGRRRKLSWDGGGPRRAVLGDSALYYHRPRRPRVSTGGITAGRQSGAAEGTTCNFLLACCGWRGAPPLPSGTHVSHLSSPLM